MTSTLWIAACFGSAFLGAIVMAFFAGSRIGELLAAHSRASDALSAKQSRINRALEQETTGANATVARICRILRGEQA